MPYKTILTLLSAGPNPLRGLNAAISKAVTWDAHLNVLCVGVDGGPHSFSYAEISPVLLQGSIEEAQKAARALADQAHAELDRQGMRRYTVTPVVSQPGILAGAVRRYARFSDLVVLPKPYGPLHAIL